MLDKSLGMISSVMPTLLSSLNDKTKSIPSNSFISDIILLTSSFFKSLLISIISGLTILYCSFNTLLVLTLSNVSGNDESSL